MDGSDLGTGIYDVPPPLPDGAGIYGWYLPCPLPYPGSALGQIQGIWLFGGWDASVFQGPVFCGEFTEIPSTAGVGLFRDMGSSH